MCTLNKPLKIPAVQLVLKYSQPPTFLNLRGHPSSNLSVEVLTQLPFHTCGILCSLDTTQHVPMFPAGRVSMVTRILLGYCCVFPHNLYNISVFMIGDRVCEWMVFVCAG